MNKEPISILFFGSPHFAIPSLETLFEDKQITISAAVSQSDKASGRGQKLNSPPLAIRARELNIPVFQPSSLKYIDWETPSPTPLKEDETLNTFCNFLSSTPKPDFLVVVAYGKLLPASLLKFSRKDSLNVHPSLLPRWRGAAPLQHTLFSGDSKTGVCIIRLVPELDAGPVFLREEMDISIEDNLSILHDKLSINGALLLRKTIHDIVDTNLEPLEQDEKGLTYATKWLKEDCRINWSETSLTCLNRIRACSPHPGAVTTLGDKDFKILAASIQQDSNSSHPSITPGKIIKISEVQIGVTCGDGKAIEIKVVQLAGKKALPVTEFLKGFTLPEKTILS